ncbi:bifunctional folylpolyglutamate synthase/dihydrofolate synthase [Pedobacter aquae]|nr:folylpolyglutamate synthase/dihydrofolate synthase family protein [Pedobacter aquae]
MSPYSHLKNYQQTLDYLYAKLPMFTRIGAEAIKKDLTNTLAFCEVLGNPHQKIKTIHVAGTNGKGSVSHMLAAILQESGYKTGLYTSPHLRDFRERIKINGVMMPEDDVIQFVRLHQQVIEDISPSFFEVTVAMAFDYFAQQEVDIAIIEVGLGGRLDSTNIITPELSVITNIGYDHMNILGDTLAQIASEKAGIIKQNIPVVVGEYLEETLPIFTTKAKQENAAIRFAADELEVKVISQTAQKMELEVKSKFINAQFSLDLAATYQIKNFKAVLLAVDELQKKGYQIKIDELTTALSAVKQISGLMGRWQVLQQKPLVICDTGHNEDGIKEVLKNIALTSHQNLHMVIGMVKDKDITKVLSLLPLDAIYYFCAPQLERAKPAQELANEAISLGFKGEVFPSVLDALEAAKNEAKEDDLVFVGGSTFVVAEVV